MKTNKKNTTIGILQEIKSKKTIDKLSLVSEKVAKVLRNKQEIIIPVVDIVKDDIILLEIGNQIVTDCEIRDGEVEVNESLITGEIDPIKKKDEAAMEREKLKARTARANKVAGER